MQSKVKLILAPASSKNEMADLAHLYLSEHAELYGLNKGKNGRYELPYLAEYWTSEGKRWPYLIQCSHATVGFALVRMIDGTWDMAEFYVLPDYRRDGVGLNAISAVWKLHPGSWQIRVLAAHKIADQFWRRAIAATETLASPMPISHHGQKWHVYRFNVSG